MQGDEDNGSVNKKRKQVGERREGTQDEGGGILSIEVSEPLILYI